MPLSAGARLGPYEILAPIGKGGMGEVHRARDTKLDRDVAIKILPDALAQDPERLARFEREAKVLASLNHPNIAQIYGVEERALVMELIEGEMLGGPVPLETALNYARQIADALEAAHEKGITHRDLKPANIKVTPAGVVKVLDFGLAAVAQTPAGREGNQSNSPTLTMQATQAGMIMGTAAYMSPEQASGKPVDTRADIWSFGVVLWEMLTGKRLFDGETISHTLAAVLTKEPDLQQVPVKVRRLLQSCLQKDARQRLQAIGDWRLLLEEAPTVSAPVRSRFAWVAAGMAVFMAAALGFGWWRATRPEERKLQPLVRLDIDLGTDVSLGSPNGADVIVSPDGTRLVYVSQNRLFTRRLDQTTTTELTGTDGADAPFFSPDGQWVAFSAQGKLKKTLVAGGSPVALCTGPSFRGGSWGEDGNIIAALSPAGALSRISSAGGVPTAMTELAPGEATHRWPQILPGGKAVLFTSNAAVASFDKANIEVFSITDHRRKTLVRGGTFGRYLSSGHLIYLNAGTVFGVHFDPNTLEIHGTPVPLLDQVNYSVTSGAAQLDFSSTGTMVYRGGGSGGLRSVQWLDSAGKVQPLLAKPGAYAYPRLSPDGQRLVLSVADLWVYDLRRDTETRLTFDAGAPTNPAWTPDGRHIVFQAPGGIFWTRSDGASKPQPLIQSKNPEYPRSFTPNGKRLVFVELKPGASRDLWTVPVESDGAELRAGKPEPFLQTPFEETYPAFSPDGQWLAYSSNESGNFEIYVRAFPDKGGKWQISNSGGLFAAWSRNARELFFLNGDNRIMAAAYTVKGDSFEADKPRVWSEKRLAAAGLANNFDLAPDGKRMAALMLATPEATNHVVFLMNFFDELRRKVPSEGKP